MCRLVDGTYTVVQCRRIKQLQPNNLRSAVDDFLGGEWAGQASSFVYFTAADATSPDIIREIERVATEFLALGKNFQVVDGCDISESLRSHPTLVEQFFGEGWAKEFCVGDIGRDARVLAEYRRTLESKIGLLDTRGLVPGCTTTPVPLGRLYVDRLLRITRSGDSTVERDLRSAVSEFGCLLLSDDTGAGKSSLLRSFTIRELARFAQSEPGSRLPLLLRAKDMSESDDHDVAKHIAERFGRAGESGEALRAFINKQLATGSALVLIDGLDETIEPARLFELERTIEGVVLEHADLGNTFVVTTRNTTLTRNWHPARFFGARLSPMTLGQASLLGSRWEDLSGITLDRASLHDLCRSSLVSNPLLFVMALSLIAARGATTNKLQIYDGIVQLLLKDWQQARGIADKYTRSIHTIRLILEHVARAMRERGAYGSLSQEELVQSVAHVLSPTESVQRAMTLDHAEFLVHSITDALGILIPTSPLRYVFMHPSIEDYFAALWLTRAASEGHLDKGEDLLGTRWRAPLLIAITMQHQSGSATARIGESFEALLGNGAITQEFLATDVFTDLRQFATSGVRLEDAVGYLIRLADKWDRAVGELGLVPIRKHISREFLTIPTEYITAATIELVVNRSSSLLGLIVGEPAKLRAVISLLDENEDIAANAFELVCRSAQYTYFVPGITRAIYSEIDTSALQYSENAHVLGSIDSVRRLLEYAARHSEQREAALAVLSKATLSEESLALLLAMHQDGSLTNEEMTELLGPRFNYTSTVADDVNLWQLAVQFDSTEIGSALTKLLSPYSAHLSTEDIRAIVEDTARSTSLRCAAVKVLGVRRMYSTEAPGYGSPSPALSGNPGVLATLLGALQDSKPEIRYCVLRSMRSGPRADVRTIEPLLDDPSELVVKAALWNLTSRPDSQAARRCAVNCFRQSRHELVEDACYFLRECSLTEEERAQILEYKPPTDSDHALDVAEALGRELRLSDCKLLFANLEAKEGVEQLDELVKNCTLDPASQEFLASAVLSTTGATQQRLIALCALYIECNACADALFSLLDDKVLGEQIERLVTRDDAKPPALSCLTKWKGGSSKQANVAHIFEARAAARDYEQTESDILDHVSDLKAGRIRVPPFDNIFRCEEFIGRLVGRADEPIRGEILECLFRNKDAVVREAAFEVASVQFSECPSLLQHAVDAAKGENESFNVKSAAIIAIGRLIGADPASFSDDSVRQTWKDLGRVVQEGWWRRRCEAVKVMATLVKSNRLPRDSHPILGLVALLSDSSTYEMGPFSSQDVAEGLLEILREVPVQ